MSGSESDDDEDDDDKSIGEYAGDVGEYAGEVGEYAGEAGEYAGEAGAYPSLYTTLNRNGRVRSCGRLRLVPSTSLPPACLIRNDAT